MVSAWLANLAPWHTAVAQQGSGTSLMPVLLLGGVALLLFAVVLTTLLLNYKRCDTNQLLVIYGSVGGGRSVKVLHGGGALVLPIFQNSAFLSLEPLKISLELQSDTASGDRLRLASDFTVRISADEVLRERAAKHLLMQSREEIAQQAEDRIKALLRPALESADAAAVRADRAAFGSQLDQVIEAALAPIGMERLAADHDIRVEGDADSV